MSHFDPRPVEGPGAGPSESDPARTGPFDAGARDAAPTPSPEVRPRSTAAEPGPPYRIARLGRALASAALEREDDLVVRRFATLDELLAEGRRLQPRVCVVEPAYEPGHEPGDASGHEPALEQGGAPADVVRRIRRDLPLTDVVFWLPGGGASFVRRCFLAGARDVLIDGDAEALVARVRAVVEDQTLLPRMIEEERSGGTWRFEDLVSRSQRMWDVFEACARTAATDASVLVLGETGTGKELVARAIHRRSGRGGRFVPLNCGAVPETLIDSELFGHVEGAFTGARKSKEGLFRHAEGGTLFLDEIGNIPMEAQNRLLRTLQENTVRPVGGHEEVPVDVRVIAATSVPLEHEIDAQRFREDLFYRIDVIRLILPPLRERPEDVILLLGRFLHESSVDYSVRRPVVGEDFLDRVCDYAWPGNVRELENFVERLVLTHPGERLTATHFDGLMRGYDGSATRGTLLAGTHVPAVEGGDRRDGERDDAELEVDVDLSRPLSEHIASAEDRLERRYLEAALRETRGRVGEAATLAGVHRRTLRRKMERYGLDKQAFRGR